MTIIETSDDSLLSDHYAAHWAELDPTLDIIASWRERYVDFVHRARAEQALRSYLAVIDGVPIGSACCHVVERRFPMFGRGDVGGAGYIWGVYVAPQIRGRGIGKRLIEACVEHLTGAGCSRVLLHAGERSRPLYERLGFAPTLELALRP
jgi:GNAT superfamily N-acetyltransferase